MFINLVPGSYTVTFTLPGFTTVKREGVEVTGAFVATINADMRVGAIEETISVTGETPIVDVQSTTKQRVVTRETMDAVPTSRVPYELAVLVPGVTARNNAGTAAVQDVGGTAGNQAQNGLVSHGSKTTDMRVTYNGVMLATMETGKNAGVLSNTAAYQEITVDNSAVSAELSTGGPRLNLIPREGGNIFHGSLFGSFTNHSLQGSNFTSDLKSRGLATADSMKKLWDINPGFGGPLLRDKLWFFTTVRHNGWQNNPGGFIANLNGGNPDSFAYAPDPNQPQSADSWWFDAQARITWQATPRNKIAFTYDKQVGVLRTGSATTAPEAVTPSRYDPKSNIFVDWTAPLTNRILARGRGRQRVRALSEHAGRQPLFRAPAGRSSGSATRRPASPTAGRRASRVTGPTTTITTAPRSPTSPAPTTLSWASTTPAARGTRSRPPNFRPSATGSTTACQTKSPSRRFQPKVSAGRTRTWGSTRRIDGRCGA